MKLKRKARRNLSDALANVQSAIDQVYRVAYEAGHPKLADVLGNLGYAATDKMARRAKVKNPAWPRD